MSYFMLAFWHRLKFITMIVLFAIGVIAIGGALITGGLIAFAWAAEKFEWLLIPMLLAPAMLGYAAIQAWLDWRFVNNKKWPRSRMDLPHANAS